MSKITRIEFWKQITKKYPSLNNINIDGHKGYGYLTWKSLIEIAKDLGVIIPKEMKDKFL